MASFPVPVNNNLNKATNQLPISGDTGVSGALGGIKADGTTITVDQTTGVASASGGGGGGNLSGNLTPGIIPVAMTPNVLMDSTIDYDIKQPDALTIFTPAREVYIASDDIAGITLCASENNANFDGPTDGSVSVYSGNGMNLVNDPVTPSGSIMNFQNYDGGGISLQSNGGISVQAAANVDQLTALLTVAWNTGAIPMTYLTGMEIDLLNNGGGTIHDLVAIKIPQPDNTGGDAINTCHLIEATLSGITATFGNYFLFLQGSANNNLGSGTTQLGDLQIENSYLVSGLPAPSGALKGMRTFVTDALGPVFLANVAGAGGVYCPVFCDGSNWIVG